MKLISRIKNDNLLLLILYTNKPINRYSFFTFFLFRILILSMLFSLTNSVIIILPLTFYFMYNLLKARCKDMVKSISVKLKVLIIICTLILTQFFYMSFTVFIFYIYHIPPELLYSNEMAGLASFFSFSVLLVNLIHIFSGIFSIIIIIIFSLLKGNKSNSSPDTGKSTEDTGFVPDYPWTKGNNIFRSMFLFNGEISRTGFLYNIFILTFFSFIVIFVTFLIVLSHKLFSIIQLLGSYDISDSDKVLILIVSLILFILNAWVYLAVITKRLAGIGWMRFLSIPIFILIIISTLLHPFFIRFFFTTIIFRLYSVKWGAILNQYLSPLVSVTAGSFRTLTVIIMALLYFIPGKKDKSM